MAKPVEYDLYFDESGTFMETSTDSAELAEAAQGRIFPSQLVGVLAIRDTLNRKSASELLQAAGAESGIGISHATDIRDKTLYNQHIAAISRLVRGKGWQPVRLVNEERLQFGNRATTYVDMVAELAMRICRQKLLEGQQELALHLYPARVLLEKRADELIFLEEEQYRKALQEYFAFANIRHGLGRESSRWRVLLASIGSGRDWPELHLCDWLSNSSHDNFCRCQAGVAASLRELFGAYNQSLFIHEPLERARRHHLDGNHGLALQALAESALGGKLKSGDSDSIKREAALSLQSLSVMAPRARDAHLQVLTSWVEQIIDARRDLALGRQVIDWIEHNIYKMLLNLLPGDARSTVAWFGCALAFWALTACNHAGDPLAAAAQAARVELLMKDTAGDSSHASLIARSLIAQAVHLTDCFDHARAAKLAGKVVSTFGGLTDLLASEMGASGIKSDLRAMALGTQMQAEIFACLANPDRLPEARDLSGLALHEFTDPRDLQRQQQYRAHLEASAGNWSDARRHLALSIQAEDDSHDGLARRIKSIAGAGPGDEGFPLLHWLRLGAMSLGQSPEEMSSFLAALGEHELGRTPWAKGERRYYPAHGIMRRLAVIFAFQGNADEAQSHLARIYRLLSRERCELTLGSIYLAGLAEVGSIIGLKNLRMWSRLMVSGPSEAPSFMMYAPRLRDITGQSFPTFTALLTEGIGLAGKGNPTPENCRALALWARQIGY